MYMFLHILIYMHILSISHPKGDRELGGGRGMGVQGAWPHGACMSTSRSGRHFSPSELEARPSLGVADASGQANLRRVHHSE